MSKFKWFEDKEIEGLKEDLVYRLDRARDLFGSPIVITSGFRDPSKNAEVGGVKNSSHERGYAVDIRCQDNFMMKKLIWSLGCAGIRRIGAYDRHVHADCDPDLPQNVMWEGKSQ